MKRSDLVRYLDRGLMFVSFVKMNGEQRDILATTRGVQVDDNNKDPERPIVARDVLKGQYCSFYADRVTVAKRA